MTDVVLNSFFPDGSKLLQWILPGLWESVFGPDVRCSMPAAIILDTVIANPAVAASAVLGILIGSSYSIKCMNLYFRTGKYGESYIFYGLSFAFFALMNTSAVFYHCIHPPLLYIKDIGLPIPYHAHLTHLAHVVDISSTCCSCLSFIIGRLYHIHALQKWDPRVFIMIFAAIYVVSYFGLIEMDSNTHGYSTLVPFLGELLYPGILACTVVTVPFLQWPRVKYPNLLLAFVTIALAFAMGFCELYLCRYLGSHFTAPMWAFVFCDIAFLFVADLISVK